MLNDEACDTGLLTVQQKCHPPIHVLHGIAYQQHCCAAAALWCSFKSRDFGLQDMISGNCSCFGLRCFCLYWPPCLSARSYSCMGRRAEEGPVCWISLAKASFPTRIQTVLEPGEWTPLPEGSARPRSKHRDVQVTWAHPTHLHRSALLYNSQRSRSKALGKLWPRRVCIMPPRCAHSNSDGSLRALGKTGYKAQLLHITAQYFGSNFLLQLLKLQRSAEAGPHILAHRAETPAGKHPCCWARPCLVSP